MQLANAATNRRGALAAARAASRPPPPPGAGGCPMGFGRAAGEKNERAVAPVRASPARSSLGEKAKLWLSSLKNLVPNGNAGAAEVPLPEDPKQPPSLFDRLDAWAEAELGLDGAAALQATVDLFYDKNLSDQRILHFFHDTDLARLKSHQFNFLQYAFSEGRVGSYNGRSIEKAHERKMKEEGMDEHSFDAVADNLLATLAELKVPQDIVDDVVAIVLPFRDLFEVSTHAAPRLLEV